MSFCIKCGNKLPDEAIFCGNCGYKVPEAVAKQEQSQADANQASEIFREAADNEAVALENEPEACGECESPDCAKSLIEEPENSDGTNQTENNNSGFEPAYASPVVVRRKKKPLLRIGIVLVLVIALCAASAFIFSNDQRSPKKTIEKYVEAVVDGDAEEVMEVMYPKSIIRRIVADRDMTMEQFEESLEDNLEYMEDSNREKYGRNLRGRVRILSSVTLDREDVRYKEESIEASYDVNIDISQAVEIECELTLRGSKGSEVNEETITLYKIGRKWYALEMV